MNRLEDIGAIVSRGIGVLLIILGLTDALYFVPMGPNTVQAGWTSYSPITTQSTGSLHDAFYMVINSSTMLIPSVVEAVAGMIFLLAARRIGKWLAHGLSTREIPHTSDDHAAPRQ